MRWRLTVLLLVGAAVAFAACGPRSRPPVVAPGGARAASGEPVRLGGDGRVRSVPLEEYVAGCVVAELGAPRAEADAAEVARAVQAILCRSYAVAGRNRHAAAGFDLCPTTHCQVYRAAPGNGTGALARAAAEATRGAVLVYRGTPIRPVYHASCGGRTSAGDAVWPGPALPWLVSQPDKGCEREAPWHFTVSLDALGRALAADDHVDFRGPLQRVEIAARDGAGRAATIRLVGRSVRQIRSDAFRSALLSAFGTQSVRSTLFTLRTSRKSVVFEGRGSGHGVGLCQAGALRRAARGESAESILRHYYPGTTLAQVE